MSVFGLTLSLGSAAVLEPCQRWFRITHLYFACQMKPARDGCAPTLGFIFTTAAASRAGTLASASAERTLSSRGERGRFQTNKHTASENGILLLALNKSV